MVLELGPELEPVLDRWLVEDAEDGSRWIRSGQGFQQFVYLDNGAPASIYRRTGHQDARGEVLLDTLSAFGGVGYPAVVRKPDVPFGPTAPSGEDPLPEVPKPEDPKREDSPKERDGR